MYFEYIITTENDGIEKENVFPYRMNDITNVKCLKIKNKILMWI